MDFGALQDLQRKNKVKKFFFNMLANSGYWLSQWKIIQDFNVSSANEANPSIFHVGHPKDLIEASPTNMYHHIAPNSKFLDFSAFTSVLNFFASPARALERENFCF